MKFTKRVLALASAVVGLFLLAPLPASADDIYTRSGTATTDLKLSNITPKLVKDGDFHYSSNGRDSHRPINEISRLELTGETVFNGAEKAYADAKQAKDPAAAKAKYAEALSGYNTTMGSTNKPWLKDFIAQRMTVVAPLSGRFDVALDTWKLSVEKDAATAERTKPSIADVDEKSQYLTNAVKALQTWEAGSPKPESRRAYLGLLYDIQLKLGDVEAANKTLEKRAALGGTPEEVNEVTMLIAKADLAAKRYDAALERAGKINPALLTDAGRGDIAYIYAEAKAAKMAPTATADEWKDLAIEYMKAVVGAPKGPNAGPALLKVAQIHETSLKEPDTALKIYQQVVRDYATTPAAQAAQQGIDRLGKTARNG